ncbi:MAG: AEC family transporter [Eubacterium sp.]|nr:AEC family transporter [Eubacterium sp.]
MSDILIRAGCFCGIILLGYVLKRVGLLQSSDFKIISRIVINVTLPASIIVNFTGQTVEAALFLMTAIGLGYGILLIAIGYVMEKRRGKEAQGFAMINLSGCNVGNFSLPFVQSFLGPVGVMVTSLFDAGNVVICFGGSYAAAHSLQDGGRISFRPILRKMAHSAPFLTYIIMTVLTIAHITLPAPVLQYAGIIAGANAFLAMFMIGVGFRLDRDPVHIKAAVRILAARYLVAILGALAVYFLLPLPLEYRQPLVILLLSPIGSAATAYTAELKGDYGLSSAINSMSILISIVLITGSLLLML